MLSEKARLPYVSIYIKFETESRPAVAWVLGHRVGRKDDKGDE